MKRTLAIVVCALLSTSAVTHAQQPATDGLPSQEPSADRPDAPPADADQSSASPETGITGERIFGFIPNYTTVEGATKIAPVSVQQKFHMAAQDSFDTPVFPFVAFTTLLAQAQGEESSWGTGPGSYFKRYATTFSDDVIATFMTTAIMPSLLHQDPRYFQMGEGNPWHRAGYAASRSFVTRGRLGREQFNYSDVFGNFIAASASNLYHPPEDRSWSDTVSRWGTQMMWDVLSSELKEFWPDIRKGMHRRQKLPVTL